MCALLLSDIKEHEFHRVEIMILLIKPIVILKGP